MSLEDGALDNVQQIFIGLSFKKTTHENLNLTFQYQEATRKHWVYLHSLRLTCRKLCNLNISHTVTRPHVEPQHLGTCRVRVFVTLVIASLYGSEVLYWVSSRRGIQWKFRYVDVPCESLDQFIFGEIVVKKWTCLG